MPVNRHRHQSSGAGLCPLYERVSAFEELLALDDEELRGLIKPVAHCNRKTVNLTVMARQIVDEHGGRIPPGPDDTSGRGTQSRRLMMNFIFAQDTVAVDAHILYLLNRLEIVNTGSVQEAADVINAVTSFDEQAVRARVRTQNP